MSEITYTKQGDYLIPDLTLPTEPELPLGRYAMMHRDYLEKHKRVTYLNLLTTGGLTSYLHQTEQAALQRLEFLTKQLASEQGVTEELKENAAWANEFTELYASLSPEEYRAAKESTLTAFYTPPVVIKAMYEALDRLGFTQGSILEIILLSLIQSQGIIKKCAFAV